MARLELSVRCQPCRYLVGCDMHRLTGWLGLFHVNNQGRHVVRMFDAEGDNGGTRLGQDHLGEERL